MQRSDNTHLWFLWTECESACLHLLHSSEVEKREKEKEETELKGEDEGLFLHALTHPQLITLVYCLLQKNDCNNHCSECSHWNTPKATVTQSDDHTFNSSKSHFFSHHRAKTHLVWLTSSEQAERRLHGIERENKPGCSSYFSNLFPTITLHTPPITLPVISCTWMVHMIVWCAEAKGNTHTGARAPLSRRTDNHNYAENNNKAKTQRPLKGTVISLLRREVCVHECVSVCECVLGPLLSPGLAFKSQ